MFTTQWIAALLLTCTPCAAQGASRAKPGDAANCKQRYTERRAFDDPGTHQRWVLWDDTEHPAGPRLLSPMPGWSPSATLIHSGDLIMVTQQSGVAHGRMQATALHNAARAEWLRVRLKSNGHILTVIVDGPGRASMPPEEAGR